MEKFKQAIIFYIILSILIIIFTACTNGNIKIVENLVSSTDINPIPELTLLSTQAIEIITPPAYYSWQEVFAVALAEISENDGGINIVFLIDIDFDEIPEIFTAIWGYGPNIYIKNGYKYTENDYTEIIHDNGLLSDLLLYRDKKNGKLQWFTQGFYRLNFYDNMIQWNTVDFSDLSNVKTELFFGYINKNTLEESDEPSTNFVSEFFLMENKDDIDTGILMEYSEIEQLQEELFSEYEIVDIEILHSESDTFYYNFYYNSVNRDNLMSFFSKWGNAPH